MVQIQVLLGMSPRMGIPLAAFLVVHVKGGPLAENGFVYYILTFYLVTLAVETFLLVGNSPKRSPKGSTKTQAG